jgi:hypothetical protein
MEQINRPPLGLIPKKYYYEQLKNQRLKEVCEAITRYYNAGLHINIEWVEEYNELIELEKQEDNSIIEFGKYLLKKYDGLKSVEEHFKQFKNK